MKRMMKIELRRAFTSPGCVLALILGCLIAAVHWALFVLPLSSTLEDYVEMNKAMMYPGWLYTSWIGSDTTAIPAYLLFLILPIMAVLPHADTFFTDAGSGFIQNICIRTSHKNYYIAKYTATFLSGGVVTVVPFLLNFLLSCLVLPAMRPETAAFTSSIGEASTFPHLFFNHPLLYVGVYLLIIFIFCGLLATISLISSYFAGYRFLVILSPFLLYLIVSAIFQLIGLPDWQPINLLNPSYPGNTLVAILVECILLLLFTQYGFIVKGTREDIY